MLPKTLKDLIDQLKKLPGIGPKTAERLTFHLLRGHRSNLRQLGEAVLKLAEGIHFCSQCFNVSEKNLCGICGDMRRDHSVICVVEEPTDALAIENTHEFRGLYHVLHGKISPLDRMHPKDLKIDALMRRVRHSPGGSDTIQEVILATNPDAEGETTALYLAKLLKPLGIKITRIARGIPVGSDLEYADQITLTRALDGRQEFFIS